MSPTLSAPSTLTVGAAGAAPQVGLDTGLERLVLDQLAAAADNRDLTNAITAAELERTIDGASTLTLTVHDEKRTLLTSGAFQAASDVLVDGVAFRLVKITKQGDDLTLTFEDRDVARLRLQNKPLKANRANTTRAQFVQRLVRELKSPALAFHSPELYVRQPIDGASTGTAGNKITGTVSIFGDLVADTSRAELKKAIPGCHIYAQASKHMSLDESTIAGGRSGLSLLQARNKSLGETVVIALGTNDDTASAATFEGWVNQAMAIIGPKRTAVFATVTNNAAINTGIRAARAGHANMLIAEWNAVHAGRVAGDGITPTAAGARTFANLIAQQIRKVQIGTQTTTETSRAATRKRGIPATANLKVKDNKASKAQIRTMNKVLDAAYANRATPRALLALVAAVIVECEFRNVQGDGNDAVSFGVIQAIPGTSGGIAGTFTKAQALDIAYCVRSVLRYSCTSFENSQGGGLNGVAGRHTDWSIGRIAANVINGSVNNTQGAPDYVNKVNQYKGQAQAIIKAYGDPSSATATSSKRYEFSRGQGATREDSWTCIQRLASEVKWRAFMVAGTLYFISDDELLASQPQNTITETSAGISSIDFDIDAGKRASQATIRAQAARWTAAPGTVIELKAAGPANGRWLVATIRRSLFDVETEITLKRPSAKLPEPKPESTGTGKTTSSSTPQTDSKAERAYSAAARMTAKKWPYVYGGGHASCGSPSGGGFDCSAAVAAVLAAAGLGFERGQGVPASGEMATSWGKPGKGKYLTMYANAEHVFLVFSIPGKRYKHFGTGDWGKGWRGAGFNPNPHPTANFTARHWPGT